MKNRLPILLLTICLVAANCFLHAQVVPKVGSAVYDTIKIADYNLLNYPGTDYATRHPYYRQGILTCNPDVLVVEEITSQAGVSLFLSSVLNYYQPGVYTAIPFHQGGPTDDTETMIYYKANKVTFLHASYIATDLRDIGEYMIRPVGTLDTVRIYVVHLKADSDSLSENRRLVEATTLRNYLNTLPAGAQFIITGDFNTYASTDKGLQKLVESETNNNGRAKDPLNPTNASQPWHSSSTYRFIHTQSPRVRAFGGGSTGGMDDRFDLMLTSQSSLDDNIILSSYTPYGNDGNHYNDSINRLPNSAVPDSVANGLHYSSDHLPVFCNFRFIVASELSAFNQLSPANGVVGQLPSGTLRWHSSDNALSYDVYLDTVNPPTTLVATGGTDTTYHYSSLVLGTTYYWRIRATNPGDTLLAANGPLHFTTANGPAKPTGGIVTTISRDSLQINWTDNAIDEDGYRMYRSDSASGPFTQVGADLPPNSNSFVDTGLGTNHRYYYAIVPFNALGEGPHASVNGSTFAVTPGAPSLSDPGYVSAKIVLDPDANPSWTEFAVRVTEGLNVNYLQTDGSLGMSPAWATWTQWGGASGFSVTGLHSCLQFAFDVEARNLSLMATAFGGVGYQSTPCFSLSDTLISGWNLVSLPVTVLNNSKEFLFPSSSSDAYSWDPGYATKASLLSGAGYWLRFNTTLLDTIIGDPRFTDSLSVKKGWNMIGAGSSVLSVDSVGSNPPGIILSPFFGYAGEGYFGADSIRPLSGYWVKVSQAGKILLPAPSQAQPKRSSAHVQAAPDLSRLNSFTFEDGLGHHQTLYVGREGTAGVSALTYELPPQPPAGAFDVRFGSQQSAVLISSGESVIRELTISVQTAVYPVKVSWNLNSHDGLGFRWTLPVDQQLGQSGQLVLAGNAGSLTLEVNASGATVIPKEFALHQNYPNPFNPSTTIAYDLPLVSQVTLTMFNILGVQVATLVDSRQEAGAHSVQWQPSVSSGIYFCRIEASSVETPAKTFQAVRRLVFLK